MILTNTFIVSMVGVGLGASLLITFPVLILGFIFKILHIF